ncbi:MAG: CPBP family intramembrane metalloprotease [Clostridia bacterium]|nr:CPBP family intramembrane metalloprotease [Clostridia bacterium]
MSNTSQYTKKERAFLSVMLLFILGFLLFYTQFPKYKETYDEGFAELLELAVTRLLCGGIFLCLAGFLGYGIFSFRRIPSARALIVLIPAMLVAVNNFPIIGLITGSVTVTADLPRILLFVLACVGIGLFEELAFRGVVLPVLLRHILKRMRAKETGKPRRIPLETTAVFLAIVGASAIFGLFHLLNLLTGADPLGVLMQIGYSFLIGGMCAIVLLKTRCIWFSVLIHTIYDLGGMMFRYLCVGRLWDTPTVILTAVLAVLVAVYFLMTLFRLTPDEVTALAEVR